MSFFSFCPPPYFNIIPVIRVKASQGIKPAEIHRVNLYRYLEIKKADVRDRKISGIFPLLGACLDKDERIRIEAYFLCHGGITFADGGENSNYPVESDLWWFGFDCAHCDDAKELKLAYERFPNYRENLAMKIECEDRFRIDGTIVRTEEYVAEECKKLAEQLKEFEESEV